MAKELNLDCYDVAIIGAGVVGCSTAFALNKRGISTINLDALPAAGYGSTSASSAIIRPMYSHWVSAAVAHESRCVWQNWRDFVGAARSNPVAEYRETGGLVLVRSGDLDRNQPMLEAIAKVGIKYEIVTAEQIARLFPGISLSSYGPPRSMTDEQFGLPTGGEISHGVYVKEAGYVSDPQLAARNLCDAAMSLGATFCFNTLVEGVTKDQDIFCLTTADRTIRATKLINASGPHSNKVNDLVGVQVPIETRPLRHEVTQLGREISHFEKNAMVVLDTDAGVYQRPEGGAAMLIGTTDPDCDADEIIDPDSVNLSLSDKWTRQAMRAAQRFPEFQIPNQAKGTVGVYDVSTDWIPIYDSTDLKGYYVAIGTSGNQFKNTPLIGEIMAQILRAPDHDKSPASLKLQSVDQIIDLGFFSRNREVQATRGVLA